MQRQANVLTMPTLAFDGERVSVKQGKTAARVRVVAAPHLLPILRDAKDENRQRILVNSFGDAELIFRKHYLAGQDVIEAIGRGTKAE